MVPDRSLVLNETSKYLALLEGPGDPAVMLARITAMAKAMQMTLSLPPTRTIFENRAACQALDCVMRAVAAEAAGGQDREEYVSRNLRLGLESLGPKYNK